MSRTLFILSNGAIGVATVALGTMQLVLGVNSPIYAGQLLPDSAILDSNLRFFGGLAAGLGLLLLYALPSIDHHPLVFRGFWFCALLGGIGRLASAWLLGPPSALLVGFAVIEVLAAVPMVYWHHWILSRPERTR